MRIPAFVHDHLVEVVGVVVGAHEHCVPLEKLVGTARGVHQLGNRGVAARECLVRGVRTRSV